jgi:type IV pilus assembly protein PilO
MAITTEDLKKLSPRMKAVLVMGACLLVAYFYYMFYLQSALEKKGNLEKRLSDLTQEVTAKQKIAAQKGNYIKQLKKLREDFKVALTKLPDEKEITGLLESVSLAGRNSGIEFLLFEPVPITSVKAEDKKKKDQEKGLKGKLKKEPGEKEGEDAQDGQFYTDIPVKVKISGTFQDTLEFFDKISQLPRIINIENLTIGDRSAKTDAKKKDAASSGNQIITTCTIKTYMFLDKEKVLNGNDEKGKDDGLKK